MEDTLVKTELEFDSMNYKQERGKIKAHPELETEIKSKMQRHLKAHVEKIDFNHKESRKEDFIMD